MIKALKGRNRGALSSLNAHSHAAPSALENLLRRQYLRNALTSSAYRCKKHQNTTPKVMSTEIPTQDDFHLLPDKSGDLDSWHAWETFGGRTLDEAYNIFRENSLFYQEDLMWMAPKPFCFYLPIVLRYLESEESTGD